MSRDGPRNIRRRRGLNCRDLALGRGKPLPGAHDRVDAEVEELNSRLAEGLKACRSIVSDYRAMIVAEQTSELDGPDSPED